MVDWPLVTSEVRMFSMEAAVKAQLVKAPRNAVGISVPVVLNIFTGNDARLVQPLQASRKVVPAARLREGKEVRPLQLPQVCPKAVPAPVLISGKAVKPLQLTQAKLKLVPAPVLINGKDVRLEQERQV